jgi:tetratricopeptide (TPR) repeat protein
MTVDIVKVTKVICALSVATLLSSNQVLAASDQLNDNDNRMVQMAFKDFDEKRFDNSEKEFTSSIIRWKELNRPRDEIVSLLKARANVRLDNKQFDKAIEDYNEALEMMKTDGETPEGLG